METQKTGYQIHLIYISTDSLEVLNSRIAERTLLGDHYVRPDIVRQRYEISLKLLNHYFSKPDRLQLFDNLKTMKLVGEFTHDHVLYLANTLPEWVTKYLKEHLQREPKVQKEIKDMTIEEVRRLYKQQRKRN